MLTRIFYSILIILAVLTLSLGIKKPEMHKSFLIYNSEYKLLQQDNEPETYTVKKNIPEVVQSVPVETQKIITNTVNTNNTVQPKAITVTQNQQQVTQTVQKIENPLTRLIEKTETTDTAVTAPSTEVQTLTQEQEVIQWNVWRSNLQNKVMQDTQLPYVPEGTIFKFKFDVDKFGRISNINTWSLSPNYTPYAIQYIAPVIRSYQGKAILNFPEGSQRYETTMEGIFKVSKVSRYSKPEDYKDTETLRK